MLGTFDQLQNVGGGDDNTFVLHQRLKECVGPTGEEGEGEDP